MGTENLSPILKLGLLFGFGLARVNFGAEDTKTRAFTDAGFTDAVVASHVAGVFRHVWVLPWAEF